MDGATARGGAKRLKTLQRKWPRPRALLRVCGGGALIRLGVEQARQFRRIGRFDPEYPRGIGVGIHLLRRVGEFGVDRDHFAGRRCVHVRRGLHGLDDAAGLVLFDVATDRGRFDEGVPADRGLGLALDRAMWRVVLPDGGVQIVSGGVGEDEHVMASADAYAPVGLDDDEHVVAVGPSGAIAMFHPHGTVYARNVAADARTAAVDGSTVLVLRRDLRTIDVRRLDGARTATHRLPGTAAPILDACDGAAVVIVGGAVRRIDLAGWRVQVVHRPATGMRVVDAQIAPGFIAVLERGPAAPNGRVLIYARSASA